MILFNSKFQRFILVIIILLLGYFYYSKSEDFDNTEILNRQNELALKDSVVKYTDLLGIARSKNYVLIKDASELDSISNSLTEEIEKLRWSLKESEGEVSSGVGTAVSMSGFSGDSTNTTGALDSFGFGKLSWMFIKDEVGYYRKLSGETSYKLLVDSDTVELIPNKTIITEDETKIEVFTFTVFNKVDSTITVIASTKNPNVTIDHVRQIIDPIVTTKINTVYMPIEKTDIGISWGLQTGVGVNPFYLTDPNTGAFQPVFYVGVGLQFDFGSILEINLPSWLK